MATTLPNSHVDIERGGDHHRTETEGSLYFTDAEEGSTCSRFYSANGGSFDDYRFAVCMGGGGESRRASSVADSECSVVELKVHLGLGLGFGKEERDCRICHLSLLESSGTHNNNNNNNDIYNDNDESGGGVGDGVAIELGCSCKDDLAVAHKHCAEAWFKIKGNKTCEICNTVARNVAGVNEVESMETSNENSSTVTVIDPPAAAPSSEARRFWNGHRFLNFLMACMVFAFVISWLFHFNVPS